MQSLTAQVNVHAQQRAPKEATQQAYRWPFFFFGQDAEVVVDLRNVFEVLSKGPKDHHSCHIWV